MMCHPVLSLQNQPTDLGVMRWFDMILKHLDATKIVVKKKKKKNIERLVTVCNLILLGKLSFLSAAICNVGLGRHHKTI